MRLTSLNSHCVARFFALLRMTGKCKYSTFGTPSFVLYKLNAIYIKFDMYGSNKCDDINISTLLLIIYVIIRFCIVITISQLRTSTSSWEAGRSELIQTYKINCFLFTHRNNREIIDQQYTKE